MLRERWAMGLTLSGGRRSKLLFYLAIGSYCPAMDGGITHVPCVATTAVHPPPWDPTGSRGFTF